MATNVKRCATCHEWRASAAYPSLGKHRRSATCGQCWAAAEKASAEHAKGLAKEVAR